MNTENKKNHRTLSALIGLLLAAATTASVLTGCSQPTASGDNSTESVTEADTYKVVVDMDEISQRIDSMQGSDYIETSEKTEYIKIATNAGDIIIRLRSDIAPYTVGHFQKLVEEGFYNEIENLIFHRVYKDFMIQGGCPKGDGTGNAGEWIMGEFAENGITNDLKHVRGVISMARGSTDMDSASCQFFICHADSDHLDGKYAAFGYVVAGMDVVDAIANVEVTTNVNGEKSVPVDKTANSLVAIKSICFVKRDKKAVETTADTTVETDLPKETDTGAN